MEISESQEMYLVTIASLLEEGFEEPIPLSKLANKLSVASISANEMIRKLADDEYVDYLPYKGVKLLPKGKILVQKILRHRRLWEVFLVDKLNLLPTMADDLACRMEHITPSEVAELLSTYLGNPTVNPQGKSIPSPTETNEINGLNRTRPLIEIQVSDRGVITRLDTESTLTSFLKAEGVKPGAEIIIQAIGNFGDMLLGVGERQVHLANDIIRKIWVQPTLRIYKAQTSDVSKAE